MLAFIGDNKGGPYYRGGRKGGSIGSRKNHHASDWINQNISKKGLRRMKRIFKWCQDDAKKNP
jgi:hypothetical protein